MASIHFYKLNTKAKVFSEAFSKKGNYLDSLDIENIIEVKDKNGVNAFYAINLKPDGYILFAADNRSQPIMGIVENSKFELTPELPEAFLGYLDTETEELERARTNNLPQLENIKKEWDAIINRPPPGGEPYFCPGEKFIRLMRIVK